MAPPLAAAAAPAAGPGTAGYMMAGGQVAQGAGQMAGGLAGIYGTYKGVQMAEKQFEENKRRYDDQLERMRMMDAISQRQMGFGNLQQFQESAMAQEDRLQDMYGSYNRQIGR